MNKSTGIALMCVGGIIVLFFLNITAVALLMDRLEAPAQLAILMVATANLLVWGFFIFIFGKKDNPKQS